MHPSAIVAALNKSRRFMKTMTISPDRVTLGSITQQKVQVETPELEVTPR
jgi:hypothetical protein